MASVNDKTTSIAVYIGDRDWLQTRQLKVSADRNQWLTMPQVISTLIEAVQRAEAGEGA
jgi:hypothetical protein